MVYKNRAYFWDAGLLAAGSDGLGGQVRETSMAKDARTPGFLPGQDNGQFQAWSPSSLSLPTLARSLRSKVSFVHLDWGGMGKESGLA